MSTYQALVLNNVCRSNHHRIAILSLGHLKAHDGERWRDMFLKWHPTFLQGAKAPDEEFKDFKNHVCHPEDNFWGGAPSAATEWYRRTVRALQQQDWEHAAWNAGVMSHYLVDPCQPFHTGQSEHETAIHRAAEWSFSKSFPELKLIIEQHVQWPDVAVPAGDDWVGQMVRDAATRAHTHYSTILDHFDLDAARRKPETGLDQELKDMIAGQLAYATVMLSRILDRAIDESKATAPKVSLTLSTLLVAIKKPLHVILKTLDNAEDRKLVEAQYQEFRRTGKVRLTMSEDDKVVRALHAEEVLETSLSSIDAEWPRELGTGHGTGAAPRVHRKIKTLDLKTRVKDGETEARAAAEAPSQTPARKPPKAATKSGKAPASPEPAPAAKSRSPGRAGTFPHPPYARGRYRGRALDRPQDGRPLPRHRRPHRGRPAGSFTGRGRQADPAEPHQRARHQGLAGSGSACVHRAGNQRHRRPAPCRGRRLHRRRPCRRRSAGPCRAGDRVRQDPRRRVGPAHVRASGCGENRKLGCCREEPLEGRLARACPDIFVRNRPQAEHGFRFGP